MTLGVGIRTARTVDIAKGMKTSGFDWLFIDLQHGPMSIAFATTIWSLPTGRVEREAKSPGSAGVCLK
jgi:2-keto-3-deoxy-L-rhamnonate aldolase RhmA